MALFRLVTLGSARLERQDGTSAADLSAQRRRLALLAIVAASEPTGITRDKLVALLWPDADDERSRRALAQLHYTLRKQLGAEPFLGTGTLRLDPEVISSDVGDLRSALRRGDGAAAARLHSGPFLDGFFVPDAGEFEQWSDLERRRIATDIERALISLEAAALRDGDAERTLEWRRRLHELDLQSGPYALAYATALGDAGQRDAALRVIERHAAAVGSVDEDEGDTIDPALRSYADRLRALPMPRAEDPRAPFEPERDGRRGLATQPTAIDAEARSDPARPAVAAIARRGRWPLRLAIGTVACLTLAVLGWQLVPRSRRAALGVLLRRPDAELVTSRIVVAPFQNLTGDTTLTGLGELAADWLSDGLLATGEFEVVDGRSAQIAEAVVAALPRPFRARDPSVALARETSSGRVITGTIYRSADSLTIVTRIIDAATGRQLRSFAHVSGVRTRSSQMLQSLRTAVVGALVSTTDTVSAGFTLGMRAPPSFEAFREIRQAWEAFYQLDSANVMVHLARAESLDSSYAAVPLVRAYVLAQGDWLAAADTALQPLRSRRESLAPVERVIMDVIDADIRGDLEGRLLAARELVRLTPASPEAYTLAAFVALNLGRPSEALRYLDGLDPDRGFLLATPYYWRVRGLALLAMRRYPEAAAAYEEDVRRFPAGDIDREFLVVAETLAGNDRRAVAAAHEPVPGESDRRGAIKRMRRHALALVARGDSLRALLVTDSLLQQLPRVNASGVIDPADAWLRMWLLLDARRWQEANALLPFLNRGDWNAMWLASNRAMLRARLGVEDDASRTIDSLATLNPRYRQGSHLYFAAALAAQTGQADRAITLLDSAFRAGYAKYEMDNLPLFLDPNFRSLQSDPRFRALLAPQ